MNLIKIMGSNATGKGTRLFAYVEHMGDDYETITYDWLSKTAKFPEGRQKSIVVGRLYPCGTFIAGNTNKPGTNWVGTDYLMGHLGNAAAGSEFFNWLKTNYNPNVVITEGYFGIDTQVLNTHRRLPKKEGGELVQNDLCPFERIDTFVFLYQTVEDFIRRTESRSGSSWEDKGKDPHTSAGWASNRGWLRSLESGAMAERQTSLEVLCPFKTPRDYFVTHFT